MITVRARDYFYSRAWFVARVRVVARRARVVADGNARARGKIRYARAVDMVAREGTRRERLETRGEGRDRDRVREW